MKNINTIFYRRKQTAFLLGVSIRTVDRYIRLGTIKASKQGRIVLIHADSVTKENILSIKPKFQNQL